MAVRIIETEANGVQHSYITTDPHFEIDTLCKDPLDLELPYGGRVELEFVEDYDIDTPYEVSCHGHNCGECYECAALAEKAIHEYDIERGK